MKILCTGRVYDNGWWYNNKLEFTFLLLQTMMKDYYKILELECVANDDEIKKAYKRLASKYHPDKNQTFGSVEKFKEIGEAYEVLSDPIRRQEYDKAKSGNVNSGPTTFIFTYHGDPLATFSQFFSSHHFMMPSPMTMFLPGGPIPPPPDHMPPPMAMFSTGEDPCNCGSF